jgi:hypothetical protein
MNLSGSQYNKAFQAVSTRNEPYYYISAHLDLTDLYTGAPSSSNPYIIYFNKENNYNYLDMNLHPNPDEYGGFYPIDDNSVIGEVTVYANPDLEYTGLLNTLEFDVGGAFKPSIALDTSPVNAIFRQSLDVWGGPTGNTPGPITPSELEDAQVCYYGREPEFPITSPTYDPSWGTRKFLALKYRIVPIITFPADEVRSEAKKAKMLAKKAKERVIRPRVVYTKRPRFFREIPGEDEFTKGKVYVVVKVYPKFE